MKTIHFYALLISVLLVGCKQQPQDQPYSTDALSIATTVESSGEVWCDISDPSGRFAISSVATRINVDGNVFEAGDKIGLYVVEWAGATAATQVKTNVESAGNQTDNHGYTYIASPKSWSASALTNPLTWRKVSVFAYHPYSATVADALQIPVNVRTDQRGGVVTSDYFMWGVGATNDAGYTPATNPAPIGLTFSHKMAHVQLKVTLPSSFNGETITSLTAASVLGVPVKGNKMNLQTGVITGSGVAADSGAVNMYRTDTPGNPLSCEFTAVIAPLSVAAGRELLKIEYVGSKGAGSLYFYASSTGFTFEQNKRYVITLATEEFGFAADLPEFLGEVENSAQTFTVLSSDATLAWGVASGDPSWITVSEDNGVTWVNSLTGKTGRQTYKIKVLKNTTGQSRMSKLTLSATGKTAVELVVFQQKNII